MKLEVYFPTCFAILSPKSIQLPFDLLLKSKKKILYDYQYCLINICKILTEVLRTISKLSHLSNVQPMVGSIIYFSSCRISFSICLIPKRNLWRNRVLYWKHLKTHTKVNFNIRNFSCKLKTSKQKQQQKTHLSGIPYNTASESKSINK